MTNVTFTRKTQAQLPNALHLQSSSTLGTGYVKTHQERLDKDEDKEVRRIMDGRQVKTKGKRTRGRNLFSGNALYASDEEKSDGENDDHMESSSNQAKVDDRQIDEGDGSSKSKPVVLVDTGFSTSKVLSLPAVTKISEVGSALRRNDDGSMAVPHVSKKIPKGTKVFTQT